MSALSLRNSRTYSDMVILFQSLRNVMAVDFGFSCIISNTRGGGVRLQQRCSESRFAAQMFSCRVPPV